MKIRNRNRHWKKQRREFVYLDEVSVTSLIAARDGAIAESVKETLTRSSEAESKTTVGYNPKPARFGTEIRAKLSNTSATEVVRKAVIQSTFRELRTGEDDIHLVTKKLPWWQKRPRLLRNRDDLERQRKKLSKMGLLMHAEDIRRGDVLELEVKVKADRTYEFITGLSSIVDIVKDREDLFGIDKASYQEVVSITEVLDRLLVGLVPISGTSERFAVFRDGENEYILDRDAVEKGSELDRSLHPLEVVGVTNLASYSKDLRTILFSDEPYTAYLRAKAPKLGDSWNPVKLSGVLRTMSIDIEELVKNLPAAFGGTSSPAQPEEISKDRWVEPLAEFGSKLRHETGVSVSDEAIKVAALEAVTQWDPREDIDSRRLAFDVVVNTVCPDADRETVRRLREATAAAVQVLASSTSIVASPQPSAPPSVATRKLEVEFVAIYW